MDTTTHFQRTITYEKFNKPYKVPREFYVDMLLDWRLELMAQKEARKENTADQVYLDFEIEATDRLLTVL